MFPIGTKELIGKKKITHVYHFKKKIEGKNAGIDKGNA